MCVWCVSGRGGGGVLREHYFVAFKMQARMSEVLGVVLSCLSGGGLVQILQLLFTGNL